MSSRDDATRHESSPEGSKVMNTCSMRLWKVQLRHQERSRPSVHRCSSLGDRHFAPGHHVKSLEGTGSGLKRASHQCKSPVQVTSASHQCKSPVQVTSASRHEGRRSPSALRRLAGGHREVILDCPFRERGIVQREPPAVHAKEDDEGEEQSRC